MKQLIRAFDAVLSVYVWGSVVAATVIVLVFAAVWSALR